MPPKLSDAASTATALPSNNDVVQQAAVQAAVMLGVPPYITSDSDDDDELMPSPPPSNPPKNQRTGSTLRPTEPICESLPPKPTAIVNASNNDIVKSDVDPVTSTTAKSESLIAHPDVTMTENDGTSQNGNSGNPTTEGDGDGVAITTEQQQQASDTIGTEQRTEDPNQSTPNNGTSTEDRVKVPRSFLDDVEKDYVRRITHLEQVLERKKQRVERLNSAARMAQNTPTPMWPQSAAMVATQNVLGANAAAGLPATSTTVVPPNFVPPTTTTPQAAVPPPPGPPPGPPPAPDGNNPPGERKQSRYWTADEHERFLAAIKTCGAKSYNRIAELVGTRNARQVRTHAQKFQKKLEREEAKRRDDLRRHGGAAAASSVSAVAAAAVSAVAAAMHQGTLPPDQAAAAYPHLLLPYTHPGVPLLMGGGAPAGAHAPVALPPQHDGSSSTNDVSIDRRHAHAAEQFVAPETVAAAVAAEAAALGSRVYSRPQQVLSANGNKDASTTANATATNQATTTVDGDANNTTTPMRTTTAASGSGGAGSGTEAKTSV